MLKWKKRKFSAGMHRISFSRMLAKMYSVLNQDDVVELKSSACGIAEVMDTCIDSKRSEPQED